MNFYLQVAIKVMDTSQIKEEYVVRNLEREARIMSNLSHPCIAALYETLQVNINNVMILIFAILFGNIQRAMDEKTPNSIYNHLQCHALGTTQLGSSVSIIRCKIYSEYNKLYAKAFLNKFNLKPLGLV